MGGGMVTDLDQLRSLVRRLKPAVIVNASAYTAVDRAESEADLALRVNGEAPGVLAYPGGYYDTLSQAVLNQNGYEITLSAGHGSNTIIKGLPQSLYAMKRFTMNEGVSVETMLDWISQSAS